MTFLRKIPGFRSGTRWKQVLSVFGYGVILIIIIGSLSDTPGPTQAEDIVAQDTQGPINTEHPADPEPEPEPVADTEPAPEPESEPDAEIEPAQTPVESSTEDVFDRAEWHEIAVAYADELLEATERIIETSDEIEWGKWSADWNQRRQADYQACQDAAPFIEPSCVALANMRTLWGEYARVIQGRSDGSDIEQLTELLMESLEESEELANS